MGFVLRQAQDDNRYLIGCIGRFTWKWIVGTDYKSAPSGL